MVAILINSEHILFANETYILGQTKYKDFFFMFIYPVFSFFGSFQNLVCTIVLWELRKEGAFFQYSFVNSINSSVVTFLSVFLCLTNCGQLCVTSFTYLSQLYNVFAILFLTSTLHFFNSLIQLAISFNLYLVIVQKFRRLNAISPTYIMVVKLLISIIYGIVIAISFRISATRIISLNKPKANRRDIDFDEITYHIHFNFENQLLSYTLMFIAMLFNSFFFAMLIVLNLLIVIETKRLMRRRMLMTATFTVRSHGLPGNTSQMSLTNNSFLAESIISRVPRLNTVQPMLTVQSNTPKILKNKATTTAQVKPPNKTTPPKSTVQSRTYPKKPTPNTITNKPHAKIIKPRVVINASRRTNIVTPTTSPSLNTCTGEQILISQRSRQQRHRRALRQILINFLWISVIFCSSRLVYSIYIICLLYYPATQFYELIDFLNYVWTSLVYATYFFVYFFTNKKFRRIFFTKILRQKSLTHKS